MAQHAVPPVAGADQGERSALAGNSHGNIRAPGSLGEDPLGTGDGKVPDGKITDGDSPVNVDAILERFDRNARIRLRDGPRRDYARAFLRFGRDADLDRMTRRELAGPKGKRLILEHLEKIPRLSHRWVLGALKAVWCLGIEPPLPWPIDRRRDIGKLPKAQRRRTPPDIDIVPWGRAARNETDPYAKLMVLLLLQFGLRPGSQLARLRWRNLEFDATGRPQAIVASGATEGFKTDSDVRAWLPPDVADALIAWKSASPDAAPERPILPRKGTTVRLPLDPSRLHDRDSLADFLRAFERKWGLKHLAPAQFRHFVASKLREAGLSYQASAYWQGHDPTGSGYMRDWYDNRPEDVFAEQSAKVPHGPLGLLLSPELSVTHGIRPEVLEAIQEFEAGRLGAIDLARRLDAIRRKTDEHVLVP